MSNSEFARRAKVAREALQRWFQQPELSMRPAVMWRILDLLDLSEIARRLGHVRDSEDRGEPIVQLFHPRSVFASLMRLDRFGELTLEGADRTYRELNEAVFGQRTEGLPEPLRDANVEPYSEEKLPAEIPTFDLEVAAGRWVDVDEVAEVYDPRQIDHGMFRVRIRGDSMTPRFRDGEVIEFRCLREGRDELEVGAYYYVQRGTQATFKQLAMVKEDELILRALNRRKYPDPMPVERWSIVRMARAVAKVEVL